MGVRLALVRAQPPADKHCQLAAGPHSLAMCSLLINRTHSLPQVQANTKPFPWALSFLLLSSSMSIIKGFIMMLTVRPLWGLLWKVGAVGVWASYCIAPLFRSIREIFSKMRNKNHALGFTILNIFWRGQEMGIGPFMRPIFFFLLVLSGLWKVCGRIKFSWGAPKVTALYNFWLDSCLSEERGDITWTAALFLQLSKRIVYIV